jgi:hypothetical protein
MRSVSQYLICVEKAVAQDDIAQSYLARRLNIRLTADGPLDRHQKLTRARLLRKARMHRHYAAIWMDEARKQTPIVT